jgi:hypothetical protein
VNLLDISLDELYLLEHPLEELLEVAFEIFNLQAGDN